MPATTLFVVKDHVSRVAVEDNIGEISDKFTIILQVQLKYKHKTKNIRDGEIQRLLKCAW